MDTIKQTWDRMYGRLTMKQVVEWNNLNWYLFLFCLSLRIQVFPYVSLRCTYLFQINTTLVRVITLTCMDIGFVQFKYTYAGLARTMASEFYYHPLIIHLTRFLCPGVIAPYIQTGSAILLRCYVGSS